MIRFLLDTSICIAIIRKRGAGAMGRLIESAPGTVGISAITLAELEHGVEKSTRPHQNRVALAGFCAPLEIVPFSDAAAPVYGRIRAQLERDGQVIGPMDLLIASQAVELDATLVTDNEHEFRRVAGLRVENWLV